jgi:hypothetical protein
MAKGSCVVAWERDPAVAGQQTLVAVRCDEKIAQLKRLVRSLALGESPREDQDELFLECLAEENQ